MVSLEPLFFNQLFRLKSCNLAKENVLIVAQVSKLLEPLSKKQSILSDEEKARCARFVVEPPKESFIVSHVLLRLCLASFLGCDPKEIIFGLKAKKKPYLKLPQLKESPIYFNISHSEDYVAIVFSSVEASGVDIQYHSPSVQIKTVAKRYLCQLEKKHFDNLKNDKKQAWFFRFWVIKEAISKAMGLGLSFPIKDINGLLIDEANHLVVNSSYVRKQSSEWALEFVDVATDYSCCVATAKTKQKLINKFFMIN